MSLREMADLHLSRKSGGLSKSVVKNAVSRLNKLNGKLQKYLKHEEDNEGKAMLKGDIRDVKKLIELVRKQQWKKVSQMTDGMDTEPRDEVLTAMGKAVFTLLGYD